MNRKLVILASVFAVGISIFAFPNGPVAALVGAICAFVALWFIDRIEDDKDFIKQVFVGGLLLRFLLATITNTFNIWSYFGEDAYLYNQLGNDLAHYWWGAPPTDALITRVLSYSGTSWGIAYIVGAVYFFTGQNMLAAQFLCAAIGAATIPFAYLCTRQIFGNKRAARITALLVAFFPSMIVWSSHVLKDGIIVFFLVLTMWLVLQLLNRFSYQHVFVLILSLSSILALRFYIFFMVATAITGSFLIGSRNSVKSVAQRFVVIVAVGLTLTYLGALQAAQSDLEKYGNLEQIQRSRQYLAESAASGYDAESDVSTTSGAIAVLPLGLAYLMLAPFPWQLTSVRSLGTMPEMIVWWASLPFLFAGLWYALKYRLRESFAVLLFALMLTLAYSIFQGNVGTAYRQRTQIQVFLFMFVSVGYVLAQEKRENRRIANGFSKTI